MPTKIALGIGLLLLCAISVQAQFTYIDKLHDFGNGDQHADVAHGIVSNEIGDGWYFAGYSLYVSANTSAAVFAKIDNQGDTVFTVKVDDSNTKYTITSLIASVDSSYLLGGMVLDSTNSLDFCLIKVNQDFDVAFNQSYGLSNFTEQSFGLIECSDHGYLLVGQSVDINLDSADMYAVKVDSLGNFEWEGYYGGTNFEAALSVVQTIDSGFLLLGWTQTFGAGQKDWYLVKTDIDGNQVWQKTYGNSNNQSATCIIELSDGNYLMCGGSGAQDGRIIKINASGDVQWQKDYGYSNRNEYPFKVIELDDGDLVIAGLTNSPSESDAGYLARTNNLGELIWQRKYNKTPFIELFRDVLETEDGGFILCGQAVNDSNASQDAWVLKVDSVGCPYEDCLVGIDEMGRKVVIDVWPNPTSEFLNIELQESGQSYNAIVYDTQGREVLMQQLNEKLTQLDIASLSNGVYVLSLSNSGAFTTVRFVVQH